MAIDGFREFLFCDDNVEHPVYRRGEGPAVLLMHELPGFTPEVTRLANWIVEAGFTVFAPCLFGKAGDQYESVGAYASMARACIRREFRVLAKRKSSPVTRWLRALSRSAYEELGGKGVGAIGMCMTGNFALALMVDEHVMAPVLSQPSLPFSVSKAHRGALHLSPEDLVTIKRRSQSGVPVLGMRFSEDFLCPKERFVTLRRELGEAFEGIEIDSSPGNAHDIGKRAHSVLTIDLAVDDPEHPTYRARDRVIEFLKTQLH